MNCQRTSSLLSAYLDRELTGDEMLLIRSHLAHCPACDDEYEALRMVKRLLGSLSSTEADRAWASSLTDLAVAGNPNPWGRLRLLMAEFEQCLLDDDTGVLRGRRLARSLALSALALFLVAAPFAQRESPVLSGAMGSGELVLRPVWQPPMAQPSLTPPITPLSTAPLPLSVSHSYGAADLGASSMQSAMRMAAPSHARAFSRLPQTWGTATWTQSTGNYLTFSSLEH